MKRIVGFILAVSMLFCVFATTASAQTESNPRYSSTVDYLARFTVNGEIADLDIMYMTMSTIYLCTVKETNAPR